MDKWEKKTAFDVLVCALLVLIGWFYQTTMIDKCSAGLMLNMIGVVVVFLFGFPQPDYDIGCVRGEERDSVVDNATGKTEGELEEENNAYREQLKEELEKFAVEGPFFFPEDTLTDQPERVLVSEIIREKILKLLSQEVPHGVAVSIEKMRMRDESDLMDIEAVIYCERESHKGIIIGKKGAMLKKISTLARADIERFFECRVNLSTWVKVKEDWRNRQGLIHNFGLDFQNE